MISIRTLFKQLQLQSLSPPKKILTQSIKQKVSKKPLKMPEPHECCGDSCSNCVWTTYFEALEKKSK